MGFRWSRKRKMNWWIRQRNNWEFTKQMKEKIQKKLGGLKLNVKFTIVIVLLVMVPISIFSGVLFYSIEDNTIRENTTYMQYTMERSRDNIRKNIDSVNMTTQFFLNDEPLLNVLSSTMGQERMTTEEMLEFYHSDISSLERLVNNNTLLYQCPYLNYKGQYLFSYL